MLYRVPWLSRFPFLGRSAHLPHPFLFSRKKPKRSRSVQGKFRERELIEALRATEHGGGRTANNDDRRRHGPGAAVFEGEEERLLRAVDNGDPDL